MSQPIETLKKLLQIDEELVGTIIEIRNNEFIIATKRGMKKAQFVSGISVGNTVLLSKGVVSKISTNSAQTYFV